MVPFAQALIDGHGWRNAHRSFRSLVLAMAQRAHFRAVLRSALGQWPFWLLMHIPDSSCSPLRILSTLASRRRQAAKGFSGFMVIGILARIRSEIT